MRIIGIAPQLLSPVSAGIDCGNIESGCQQYLFHWHAHLASSTHKFAAYHFLLVCSVEYRLALV